MMNTKDKRLRMEQISKQIREEYAVRRLAKKEGKKHKTMCDISALNMQLRSLRNYLAIVT